MHWLKSKTVRYLSILLPQHSPVNSENPVTSPNIDPTQLLIFLIALLLVLINTIIDVILLQY